MLALTSQLMHSLPVFGIAIAVGNTEKEHKNMLWTIFVVLLVLWALGLVTSFTMGGFIHILLVLALAMLLINIIQGRRVV